VSTCERARVRGASLRVCVHESVYLVNRWTDSIQRGGILTLGSQQDMAEGLDGRLALGPVDKDVRHTDQQMHAFSCATWIAPITDHA
jgi:hypothetical protein